MEDGRDHRRGCLSDQPLARRNGRTLDAFLAGAAPRRHIRSFHGCLADLGGNAGRRPCFTSLAASSNKQQIRSGQPMEPLIPDTPPTAGMTGLKKFLERYLGPRRSEFGASEEKVRSVSM